MNDELKATLEWLKECGNNDYIFETGNSRMLLDYITNLQQENKELKKQLEVGKEQYNDLVEEKEILQEQLSIKTLQLEELKLSKRDYTQENILTMQLELKNRQQKEFIKWLEDYLNLFDYNDIEEQAGYDMLEEILQKYKEIIGGK